MFEHEVRSARGIALAALLSASLASSSCIGARVVYPVQPTPEELQEFLAAGPADLVTGPLDVESMQVSGPYRLVAGDLLTIELPPEVQVDTVSAEGSAQPAVSIKSRVQDDGTILLPMLGVVRVAGKTTTELEDELATAYNDPTRLSERPNVVVVVSEFRTVSVAVVGAVNQPGLHDLRSDHRSVLGALMAAGGIKQDRGAREIRVLSHDETGQTVTRTLDVQAEIPLEDLALEGEETVVVEPAAARSFSVIGLVKRNGVFDYPAPRRYNLMQALATAGGVDESAAPRYATIYRVRADGTVLGATFKIDGTSLLDASNVVIKDGDVISVDHTQGSWFRQFFSQVFGFRASVNVSSTASPTL